MHGKKKTCFLCGTSGNELPSSPTHRTVSSSTTRHSLPVRCLPSGTRRPNSTTFGRTSNDPPEPWPRDGRRAQRLSDPIPTQNLAVLPVGLVCTATEVSLFVRNNLQQHWKCHPLTLLLLSPPFSVLCRNRTPPIGTSPSSQAKGKPKGHGGCPDQPRPTSKPFGKNIPSNEQ